MNRRNFLSLAALAIAGKAAERVFPFRVYSIPKEIVLTSHQFYPQFLAGVPPSLFGGVATDYRQTATGVMMEYERKLQLARITPEMLRRMQRDFIAMARNVEIKIDRYYNTIDGAWITA